MTDEQINIAIAESLGWKWDSSTFQKDRKRLIHHTSGKVCIVWGDGSLGGDKIPNYTADLNACHEFEKMLDDDLDLDYSENLELVTGTRWGANNSYDMSKYRSATARQRCEAYLKTIGKWIE